MATADTTDPLTDRPAGSGLPDIPGYAVAGEIARGGMGRVLAARELVLDREVAVKLLLPGAKAGRFVTEAKVTAQLPHPNIPPVYALGELADGSPFLAMKLVRGRTLADELKARTEVRDDLPRLVQAFEGVCQAVGFAHSRGIVHRDLKPANVMVGEFGEVQVMDWGLAKELVSREAESSEPSADAFWESVESEGQNPEARTRAGSILGTPAYMAPEQARGEAVDQRADVFALGGVLTAILTGKPAYAGGSALDVLERAAAGDTSDALTRLDGCGADAELAGIARDCLAVEAAGRPADGRVVAGRVAAYRAGVEGRLRQAERDRAAAEATAVGERRRRRAGRRWSAAVVAVVAVGGVLVGWQAVRAGRERDNARAAEGIAQTEARAAVAAKDFLARVLVQGSPRGQADLGRAVKPNPSLRAALDFAAREIDGRFADRPTLEADLRATIGAAFYYLKEYEAARPHLTIALRLREQVFGPDHPDTLRSVNALAGLHHGTGDLATAESYMRRTLTAHTAAGGPDHPDATFAAHNLAVVLAGRGDHRAAEPLLRRTLAAREAALGADHPDTLSSVKVLAALLSELGDLPAAEQLDRRVLAGRETALGPTHPDTLAALEALAGVLDRLGNRAAAEPLYRRALAGYEATHGPTHPDTLMAVNNLGALLVKADDLPAAEPLYRRALAGHEAALGPTHPDTLVCVSNLAVLFTDAGRWAEAEPLTRRVLAGRESALGADHPDVLRAVYNLATLLQNRSRLDEAEPLFRRAADGYAARDFRSGDVFPLLVNYCRCLKQLGRAAEAEGWRRRLIDLTAGRDGADSPAVADEWVQLGYVLIEQDKWAEAEDVFGRALAIRTTRAEGPAPTVARWQVASVRALVGAAVLGQGRYADAEPLLLAGYRGLIAEARAIPPGGAANLPNAADRLVWLYVRWGKPAEAANWRAERAKHPPALAPPPRPAAR